MQSTLPSVNTGDHHDDLSCLGLPRDPVELTALLKPGEVERWERLFADFTRSGKTYVAFPDALTHRIRLEDLADAAVRDRLRLVWTDPLELDPSRRSAKVTREVAARLAELAKSLERSGHEARLQGMAVMVASSRSATV